MGFNEKYKGMITRDITRPRRKNNELYTRPVMPEDMMP
jgi:hypothetical protein